MKMGALAVGNDFLRSQLRRRVVMRTGAGKHVAPIALWNFLI